MLIIQAYLCTVMFWLVMFATGRLELTWRNKETGEITEADVSIKILYSFAWIATVPMTLIRDKEDKQ